MSDIRIPYDRRAEAEAVLETESSRLGDTFRGDREGLTLEQQAELAGAKAGNYGYNNRVTIAALIEGVLPTGPTLALQAARRVRTLLKRPDLSPELRADWMLLEEQLTARANTALPLKPKMLPRPRQRWRPRPQVHLASTYIRCRTT